MKLGKEATVRIHVESTIFRALKWISIQNITGYWKAHQQKKKKKKSSATICEDHKLATVCLDALVQEIQCTEQDCAFQFCFQHCSLFFFFVSLYILCHFIRWLSRSVGGGDCLWKNPFKFLVKPTICPLMTTGMFGCCSRCYHCNYMSSIDNKKLLLLQ